MRKHLFFNSAAVLFVGIVAVGCSNEMPEYKGADLQEQAKSTFPVENIDPNQDWVMSAYRTASISVGGKASQTYDVYVFSELPTSGEATPTLASRKGVKGGSALQLSFDVAKAQETVYIARNGEDGYFIKPVALSGDTYTVDFALSAVRTRSFADKTSEMSGNPFSSVTAPTNDDFKTSVPSGSKKNATDSNSSACSETVDNIEITSGTYNLNYWSGGVKSLYINGEVTLSANASNSEKLTNIYVLPNSTLTLNGYVSNANPGVNIYVSQNATLTMGANQSSLAQGGNHSIEGTNQWVNNEINIYNKGTLNLNSTILGNGSMIYNEGTLKASNITFNSGAGNTYRGMLINKGKAEVTGDVTMTSNCSLLNDSYMHVGGSVTANQYTIWFVNTGNMTVDKNMEVSGGNNTFYNGCQIYVKETLNIDYGSGNAAFNVLSDGAFYCKDAVIGNNVVNLGARSAFIATNSTTFKSPGGSVYQGFKTSGISSSDDMALVKLGTVNFTAGGDGKYRDNYLQTEGYMILTADNINDIKDKVASDNISKMVKIGDNVTFTVPSDVKIVPNTSEDDGCLTWKPKKDEEQKTEQVTYTYGFEDMLLGDNSDYDFNDVVLYVTTPDENGQVDVTLEAAGATRQIAVKFKDKTGKVTPLWDDVHTALGVAAGTMVNTGNGTVVSSTTPKQTIGIGKGVSLKDNGDFYIVVDGKMEVHIPQYTTGFTKGDAPYAIQVPIKWKWPTEETRITDSYSGFAGWAEDVNANTDWYKTGTITNVYTK